MSLEFILEQLTSAAGGFFLGLLTAGWLHATWKRWHPQTIRFWGSWYTNPRLLLLCGLALAVLWTGMFLSSR